MGSSYFLCDLQNAQHFIFHSREVEVSESTGTEWCDATGSNILFMANQRTSDDTQSHSTEVSGEGGSIFWLTFAFDL